ncbi:MAG: hemolysin family protein [Candidatus Obscuribacterales bacterium]
MSIGSILLSFGLVLLFVVLNGLFVAIEFSVIRLRKSRTEEMVQAGRAGAETMQALQQDIDGSIAGAQLGITLASLIIGWLGEDTFRTVIETVLHAIPAMATVAVPGWVVLVLTFLFLSSIHVVLGEQVPKFLGIRFPESVLLKLGMPFRAFCAVTRPFIKTLNFVADGIIRLAGLKNLPHEQQPPSADEFQILVEESAEAGVLEKLESDLLRRALELRAVLVSEAMLPASKMDVLTEDMPLQDVLDHLCRKKHSKFPVYDRDRERVIGILNTKDLLDVWSASLSSPRTEPQDFHLSLYVRQAHFVPSTMQASALLETMKLERLQMVMVVDESESVVGLVTLEDLVEQLVGPIWDEYDKPQIDIKRLGDGVWRISGRVTVFEFASAFGIHLDCPAHCSTVAGVVLDRLGRAPRLKDVVPVGEIVFTVVELEDGDISSLEVRSAKGRR